MIKPTVQSLPQIKDRMTFIYLERCRINREDGAITATDENGVIHIPAAAVSVLLLGPGTDVSHRAMELIGSSADAQLAAACETGGAGIKSAEAS